MRRRRVLTGSISQETHSFNPIVTTASEFVINRGAQCLGAEVTPVTNGIIHAAEQRNVELIPSITAIARPGGRIQQAVYDELKEELLRVARSADVDGIALDLHGAMQTEDLDDAEGDLLASLRRLVGEKVPIAVGLDLHGHITRQMLANADVCTGYKENPHSDTFETGERTLRMLLQILEGEASYCTAMGKVPMITRGADETTGGAVKALWDHAKQLRDRHRTIRDLSIFNVQHFLDAPELGQTVLVITNDDPDTASAVCADLCSRLWEIRDDVVATYPDLDETMDTIVRHPDRRPFVVGDIGDRVVAGAPGDSTAVLQYLLDHELTLRAAIPITDPEAVRKAREAGPGAELTLDVGGAFTPSFRPVRITGRVVRHTVNDSLAKIWETKTTGDTVVFQADNIHLLLSAKSNIVMFPESFTSQGIEIESFDLVVVKSGYHFRMFFADTATALCADTPGLTVFRPEEFPFKLGRPIYPLDPVRFQPESPLLFNARQGG